MVQFFIYKQVSLVILIYPTIIITFKLIYFSMVRIDEQFRNCERVRAIIAWNPKARFHTVNTTRDSLSEGPATLRKVEDEELPPIITASRLSGYQQYDASC